MAFRRRTTCQVDLVPTSEPLLESSRITAFGQPRASSASFRPRFLAESCKVRLLQPKSHMPATQTDELLWMIRASVLQDRRIGDEGNFEDAAAPVNKFPTPATWTLRVNRHRVPGNTATHLPASSDHLEVVLRRRSSLTNRPRATKSSTLDIRSQILVTEKRRYRFQRADNRPPLSYLVMRSRPGLSLSARRNRHMLRRLEHIALLQIEDHRGHLRLIRVELMNQPLVGPLPKSHTQTARSTFVARSSRPRPSSCVSGDELGRDDRATFSPTSLSGSGSFHCVAQAPTVESVSL